MGIAIVGISLALAFTIIGAGYGISKIGATALESMARQPEVKKEINTAMILSAALIEGAALASIGICFLLQSGLYKLLTEAVAKGNLKIGG